MYNFDHYLVSSNSLYFIIIVKDPFTLFSNLLEGCENQDTVIEEKTMKKVRKDLKKLKNLNVPHISNIK